MPTPTVNIDVLRTLHRIHKQLSDLKDRRERGPRQIHAYEVTPVPSTTDQHDILLIEARGTDARIDLTELKEQMLALGERPGPWAITGAALVLGAVLVRGIVMVRRRRNQTALA